MLKPYAHKFHALKIRCGEVCDAWDVGALDLKQFNLVNLKVKVDADQFKTAMATIRDNYAKFTGRGSLP